MIWYSLLELLPPVYRKIKAIAGTAEAEDTELQNVLTVADKVRANFHVQTCDETTLATYENMFDVDVFDGQTLDERRAQVLIRMNDSSVFTGKWLREILNRIVGKGNWYWVEANQTISITFVNVSLAASSAVMSIIAWCKPAHVRFEYKTTNLAQFESEGLIANRTAKTAYAIMESV